MQLKALLAAEIVRALDDGNLTARNANLHRFTVDRLMAIFVRLGRDVNVAITVRPRKRVADHRMNAVA
jgi:hypothetical protein